MDDKIVELVIELVQDAKKQIILKNPAAALCALNAATDELAKAD